jgi:hypothetical protein
MWRKLGGIFSTISPESARTMQAMNPPHMGLPLQLAITVFFWLIAQAWTLFVFWAEGCATQPSASGAGPIDKEKTP